MAANDSIRLEQQTLWNGPAGLAWVEEQAVLDGMFKPIADILVSVVKDSGASQVLDIGCGTGGSTLAIAAALGTGGAVTGIDISEPMIALANIRAQAGKACVVSDVRFIVADAELYEFGVATFDMVVSRFGVMFFADPVAAFRQIKSAIKPDGLLTTIVWRSADDNPFMTVAEREATPFLPNLPRRDPDEPGQFAFADAGNVRSILEKSGWRDIHIEGVDVECALPASDLERYITRLGPVGRALQEVDEPTRVNVIAKVKEGFVPYVQGDAVRYTAACWVVSARA